MGQNATSAQCVVCHVWYLKPGMRMANPAFPRLNADRVCPECVADSPASRKARAMEYPWELSGERVLWTRHPRDGVFAAFADREFVGVVVTAGALLTVRADDGCMVTDSAEHFTPAADGPHNSQESQ